LELPRWLFWFILLLIPVAFLLNLGVQPFIDDEGNRSLVALEMIWSGNYITPTLHGDYYYNKPPLWNWILALSFYLHGGASEWAARFPSVLCLLGFAATVYQVSRRHLNFESSFLISLLLLTCGRILFWESLLGLIDLCFCWVVYGLIMVIFHQGQRERWERMFFFSYLLMVVAFFLKGLPAFVFQGLTLLVYLSLKKEWKRLFSLPHIFSGLLAVGLIVAYYAVYDQFNSLDNVFSALFEQSGKRTALAYGFLDTLKHVANFPLELFYHFLPWSLLLILLISKKNRERLQGNIYLKFCFYALFVNLAVYWLSPNFYPRYILMLLPLGFTLLVKMIPPIRAEKNIYDKILYWLCGIFILILAGGALATLFVEATQPIPGLYLKGIGSSLVLLALLYYYWVKPSAQFFILTAAFLVFRVGFDLLAIPPRAIDGTGQRLKMSSIEFGQRWQDLELKVFNESHMEPATSYYIERAAGRIIPRAYENFDTTTNYIYSPQQYHSGLFRNKLDSFVVRHSYFPHYYVGKLRTIDTTEIKQATLTERPKF
jgi:4-amino-4-deoxy-L-arabinose transferase-like glycosyltransferase